MTLHSQDYAELVGIHAEKHGCKVELGQTDTGTWRVVCLCPSRPKMGASGTGRTIRDAYAHLVAKLKLETPA